MMNYGRYRRNPVVDYPEREWPGKESSRVVQRRFKGWKSGVD